MKRARFDSGTANAVSGMPSGPKNRSARKSGKDEPEARATRTPWMSEQVL